MEPLHPSLSHKIYSFFFVSFLNEKFHVRFIFLQVVCRSDSFESLVKKSLLKIKTNLIDYPLLPVF